MTQEEKDVVTDAKCRVLWTVLCNGKDDFTRDEAYIATKALVLCLASILVGQTEETVDTVLEMVRIAKKNGEALKASVPTDGERA